MGKITIELEDSIKETVCDSCGGVNRLLHGYVYDDGSAHGIYILEWCDGDHPRNEAFLTLGLGRFGEGSLATDRMSFGVEWNKGGMTLMDEPVRDRPDLLGPFQPREVALRLPNIDQLWHVTDHIVLDDPKVAAIQRWLEQK